MHTVALVNLGENLSVNLNRLATVLNSLQTTFRFLSKNAMPNIGAPDVDDVWYDFDNLFAQLRSLVIYQEVNFVVGITHVRVTDQKVSVHKTEKDYFSLSDRTKVSVITEAMTYLNHPRKNKYQFCAYLIMEGLLINLSHRDLAHPAPHYCLFDECEDRSDLAKGIGQGKICRMCEGKLAECNIEESIVRDVRKVLRWCKRNSIHVSLKNTFENSLVTLLLGVGLGWFTALFVAAPYYLPVAVLTLLVPLAVGFLYYRYSAR